MSLCLYQRDTSLAVCEAIPYQNNVWHMIFVEHKRRSLSNYNYWQGKFNEANYVHENVLDAVKKAHIEGKDLSIFNEFIL
jgi:hypothetical protein